MTTKDLGGPAYPYRIPTKVNQDSGAVVEAEVSYGMTLRDYFAGQALSSFAVAWGSDSWRDPDLVAKSAYQIADAMIEARKQ